MTPGHAFSATRFLHALALCVALLAASQVAAAPLKVVGRFLQDTHGNNILMRGVNLPVYKSGYADDLDAVAAAIARTKANAVRLEWWAVPLAGQTQYSVANFDRAIQKFYDLGIIPVVDLHDLTFVYGQNDPPGGANSNGNDRAIFANTITAFWTRADVLAILVKHQDHLVINVANEWGSSFYSDNTSTMTNFIQNYTVAITAMRNAGIIAPLMVDAPKGFEYQFLLDNGPALLAADPQQNTLLSAHAYWAASDPAFTIAGVNGVLDTFAQSGLPVVLGEASSNAYTNIPCDPINYANLLTRANVNSIGYLFWAWYEDGQCGQLMNITVGPNGDGVTLPTAANPGYGYDALYAPGFGIDAASPQTSKADFSPVGAPALLNSSFSYNVTSTNDNGIRPAIAQVTRLNNFGAEKRPVVVLMPGWGGVGDVVAVRDAQTMMFANQGYVALNIGFHQTSNVQFGAPAAYYSDLAESAKAALEALCLLSYADCSAVVITGESYGGTQIHPVVRYLRASGVFDGSGGANAGRKVVGMLGQDSGYTYYYAAPIDADATAYSIAMIQNLGDMDFPVDSCQFDNCGARNRADYHQTAAGSQYVLSYCPAGGVHGSRGYADWDAWVLSAVKTMLHNQRGVPKFTGYVEPSLAVSNACVTTPLSPRAPTIGTATAANAQATVTFTAPASNGSSAITGYTVISNPPGGVDSNAGTTWLGHIVTGLTNGTSYTFTVTATNAGGTSAPSAASNSVTPATVPGAPSIGTAIAGNAQATVTFTPPVSNGGSAISGYTVTSNPAGITAIGGASPITVTGLANGTAYTFTVMARNVIGTGTASLSSNSVTPAGTPGAPAAVTAMPGDGSALVTFSAPASNGGSAITNYTATCGTQNATSTSLAITVIGLINGVAVTCTVTAANSIGSSVPSSPSNSVTPARLTLLAVQSRKTHGAVGTFDLLIDGTKTIAQAVTVEPRTIGAGHTIVFQFDRPIMIAGTVTTTNGTATATINGSAAQEVLVTLTGIVDNSRATVSLSGVNGNGNPIPPVSLGFLVGDVNNTRSVNSSDISGVKARSGQTPTATTFQFDLNASGAINSSDISAVKARSGQVLP